MSEITIKKNIVHENLGIVSGQDKTSNALEVSVGVSKPMETWKTDPLICQDERQVLGRFVEDTLTPLARGRYVTAV